MFHPTPSTRDAIVPSHSKDTCKKKARIKIVLNLKCERHTPLRLAYLQDMASLDMVSTSTTSFRLCTATRRYFLLRDVISLPVADEEDESELSALTVEPLDLYWANLEKDTTSL